MYVRFQTMRPNAVYTSRSVTPRFAGTPHQPVSKLTGKLLNFLAVVRDANDETMPQHKFLPTEIVTAMCKASSQVSEFQLTQDLGKLPELVFESRLQLNEGSNVLAILQNKGNEYTVVKAWVVPKGRDPMQQIEPLTGEEAYNLFTEHFEVFFKCTEGMIEALKTA